MTKERSTIVKGTLDLLVLKVLADGPAHGYAITNRIRERSGEEILVEEGSLYPALHRMEKHGWLEAEWGLSELNRRAQYYRLSRAGRRELALREERWKSMAKAIARVLRPAPARS